MISKFCNFWNVLYFCAISLPRAFTLEATEKGYVISPFQMLFGLFKISEHVCPSENSLLFSPAILKLIKKMLLLQKSRSRHLQPRFVWNCKMSCFMSWKFPPWKLFSHRNHCRSGITKLWYDINEHGDFYLHWYIREMPEYQSLQYILN